MNLSVMSCFEKIPSSLKPLEVLKIKVISLDGHSSNVYFFAVAARLETTSH